MTLIGRTWVRGAIAGALAAVVLAVWFLLVDLVRAAPLDTLRTAAGLAFGRSAVGSLELGLYTALHFAVLTALGTALAVVLEKAAIPLFPFIGLIVGFLLFDLAFYGSVLARGADIVERVGWPVMLAGNLLAGIAMVWTLRSGGASHRAGLRGSRSGPGVARLGAGAGLAGAAAVMVWFLGVDLLRGEPFHTPAALGSVLFHGARSADGVRITAQTVAGYTVLHILLFLALGMAAAGVAQAAKRNPPLLLAVALGFVTLQALFTGLLAALASWVLDAVAWWTIAAANLVAVLVMGTILARRHPELPRSLGIELEDEAVAGGR